MCSWQKNIEKTFSAINATDVIFIENCVEDTTHWEEMLI